MRLCDRLLANERTPDYVREGLNRATALVADNIAAYYWSGTEQDYWEVDKHFPNLAPPFPVMWIETVAPTLIRLPQRIHRWDERAPRGWAVLRQAVDLSGMHELGAEALEEGQAHLDVMVDHQMQRMRPIIEKAYTSGAGDVTAALAALSDEERRHMTHLAALIQAGQGLREGSIDPAALAKALCAERGVRWIMRDWLFLDHGDYGPYPVWSFQFYVGADGSFQRIAEGSWYQAGPLSTPPMERRLARYGIRDLEDLNADMVSLWHTSLLAVSFMHCKNVVRTVVDPVAEWRVRHPTKKGYAPVLCKYYTLDIDPMKEVLRREGRSEEVGQPRAMHICRGHFAHYSPDHPLFGKYSGTFWRPMHVRGTPVQGAVIKDYRVLAAAEGTPPERP